MPVEGKKSCCIVCIRRLAWHGMVHIATYLSMYSMQDTAAGKRHIFA